MKTILIVDDEAKIREFIGLYFRASGYCVLEAEDGTKALQLLREESVSLVILDILMPGLDGFQVCQKIREKSDVPIIILTALNEDEQHIRGYEAGADDYVSKDVNPKIIVAKAQRLLAKTTDVPERITVGPLSIDPRGVCVYLDGKLLSDFSPKEFQLLLLLAKNENVVLSREYILNHVWNYEFLGDTRVVDTHIKKIRKKLGTHASMIKTVVSLGYKLEKEPSCQKGL